MMRGTVWLIGAFGVALVWGGAVAYKARPIERQIALSTVNELKRRAIDRRIDSLAIEIDGRDLKLIGTALTPADREQALAVAAATPGVGRVTDEIKVAPEARPFVFRAVRNGDGSATLIGVVAQSDSIERLTEVARGLFHNRLDVQLRLARGAPEGDWFAAAKLAIELIAHIEQGEAALTDRRLALTGRAPDDAALELARTMLERGMPAGYEAKAEVFTALDELVRGGPITAMKDCQELIDKVMTGHSLRFDPGSAAIRAAHGRQIDRLAQAARRCASFFLQVHAAGDASVADAEANLRLGEARANAIVDALAERGVARDRMAALARGRDRNAGPNVELRFADSAAPFARPYVWQFEKHLDGTGTITGHHPSPEAESTLAGLARPALRGALTVESRFAQGAPTGDWLGAARLGIDAVAQLERGAATLRDYALHIRGVAKDDETLRLVAAMVAERTPRGFTATLDLATALDDALKGPEITAAERCQVLVEAVARTREIAFLFDGTALLERQRLLFQRLAAAAARCPAFTIEIGAHADGSGEAAAARAQSERWAQAVADALARAGADPKKLKAVGYGNSRPVADSLREEGRAANRRIVFRVTS